MTDFDRIAAALQVDRLMDAAFFPGRTPRSPEYRAGCRAALEFRFVRQPVSVPYAAGTAAADAFFAGIEEGNAIWQRDYPKTTGSDGFLSTEAERRVDALKTQGIRKAKVSK